MTEVEEVSTGFDLVVGPLPMSASGRALLLSEHDGFVRIVADSVTEFILEG